MAKAPTSAISLRLAAGKFPCSVRDAGRAIGAYAFATTDLKVTWPVKAPGTPPIATQRAVWSAEIYDFQPASPGTALTYQDLIVSIGLSSQIKERAIAGMLAVLDDVNAELGAIVPSLTFWDLPDADTDHAAAGSDLWRMWRAIELLDAVDGVGFTVAHKTLHHKRPALFPLLDNVTTKKPFLPYKQSWELIHRDLAAQARPFAALEKWFADEAAARDRPRLTRLRMHDIIVWLTGKKQWGAAVAAGTTMGF